MLVPGLSKSAADPDGLCAALNIRYACQQAPACSGSDSGGLCRQRMSAGRNFADSFLPHGGCGGERVDFCAHEAAKGVLRIAHDRLAAHAETGVDDHRTAGPLLEFRYQSVVARVGLGVHRLHPGRVVDVRHGRDEGAQNVELVARLRRQPADSAGPKRWTLYPFPGPLRRVTNSGSAKTELLLHGSGEI